MKPATIFRILTIAGVTLALGCIVTGQLLVGLCMGVVSYALTVIADAEESRGVARR